LRADYSLGPVATFFALRAPAFLLADRVVGLDKLAMLRC